MNAISTPDAIASATASVADALAALHASGRAHGSVDGDHVELHADGTGVLHPPSAAAGPRPCSPPEDVGGLGALLAALVDGCSAAGHAPPSLTRLANLARLAVADDITTRPTAAALAALLRATRAPTVLPGLEPSPRRPAPRRRGDGPPGWWHRLAAGTAVVVLAGACALAFVPRGHAHTSAPAPAPARAPAPAPAAIASTPEPGSAPAGPSRVWPAVAFRDGVLTTGTSRFTVGQRDDVVIAGDWACSGTATPALLRPATGEVYVFPSWPGAGQRVAGRLVATVAGAVGLRPSRVTTDRCAHLSALSGDGGVVPVDTGALR